jgi:hypothetical protein
LRGAAKKNQHDARRDKATICIKGRGLRRMPRVRQASLVREDEMI